MEYLVQAILIDDTGKSVIETVVNSLRTTDYQTSLEFLMKRHRNSKSYLYIAMVIESQEIVYKSKENKYY